MSGLRATRITAPAADPALDDLAYPGADVLVLQAEPSDGAALQEHLRRLLTSVWRPADGSEAAAAPAAGWLVAVVGRRDDLRFASELGESAGATLEPLRGGGLVTAIGDGHPLLEALLETGDAGGATVLWLRVTEAQREEALAWLRRGDVPAAAAHSSWALRRRGGEPWAALALPARRARDASATPPIEATAVAASLRATVGGTSGVGSTLRRLAVPAALVAVALAAIGVARSGSGGVGPAPTPTPPSTGAVEFDRLSVPARGGPAPSSRQLAASAWDASHGRMVLFGGNSLTGLTRDLADTWTWDGRTWAQESPTPSPPGRFGAVMADDGAGGVLLFGGTAVEPIPHFLQDTWRWDGAAWTLVDDGTGPDAPGRAVAMVDDTAADIVLLVAAAADAPAGPDLSWTWTGGTWRRQPPPFPAQRVRLMAYDAARRQVLAIATDATGIGLATTWSWDGATWKVLHPSRETEIEPLTSTMAFDPASRTLVLVEGDYTSAFGNAGGNRGGTWTWDGNTWSRRNTLTPAFVRPLDPTTDVWAYPGGRLVLLGGSTSGSAYRFVATWDGDAWRVY